MPPEAIRPLLRKALSAEGSGDPVSVLAEWVERHLLPLPPFEVWLADFRQYRARHLDGLALHPVAPDPGDPVAIALRPVPRIGAEWMASLEVRPEGSRWAGRIAFRTPAGGTAVTGYLLVDDDPAHLSDRFLAFGDAALEAFHRSASTS